MPNTPTHPHSYKFPPLHILTPTYSHPIFFFTPNSTFGRFSINFWLIPPLLEKCVNSQQGYQSVHMASLRDSLENILFKHTMLEKCVSALL